MITVTEFAFRAYGSIEKGGEMTHYTDCRFDNLASHTTTLVFQTSQAMSGTDFYDSLFAQIKQDGEAFAKLCFIEALESFLTRCRACEMVHDEA